MTKKTTTTTTSTEIKTTSKKIKKHTKPKTKTNVIAKTIKIKGKSLHELIGNDFNKLREKTELVEIEYKFDRKSNNNMFFIKPYFGIKIDYCVSDLKDIMRDCLVYDLIPIVTKEIFEIWKNGKKIQAKQTPKFE